MKFPYWDTSCVLKLYTQEVDSELYFEKLKESNSPICSSVLLASELTYAFHAKENRNELSAQAPLALYQAFCEDCERGRILLLPLGADVRKQATHIATRCYGESPPITLRTLDGLHLATAVVAGCRQIQTADQRMQTAALRLGLQINGSE